MSELDSGRQEFLVKTLKDVQLFITSTEIAENLSSSAEKGKIYIVKEGLISSEK